MIVKYLRTLSKEGINPAFAVLFGSNAVGESHHWSDIDLVVVASIFDSAHSRQNVVQLWRTAARVDSRIEPIPCGIREWDEDDSRAIIEIARRQGSIVEFQEAVQPAPLSSQGDRI